jgi:hypothetical protein
MSERYIIKPVVFSGWTVSAESPYHLFKSTNPGFPIATNLSKEDAEQIAAALNALPVWTREKPTVEGLFAFGLVDDGSSEICRIKGDTVEFIGYAGGVRLHNNPALDGAWWCGPLQLPPIPEPQAASGGDLKE